MIAHLPPFACALAITWRQTVVLPLDSGPKISMIRPAGSPPMPSARSSASEPVLITGTSVQAAPVSPSRMIEPLPNSFSIWLIAIARLFSLSTTLASFSAMVCSLFLFL